MIDYFIKAVGFVGKVISSKILKDQLTKESDYFNILAPLLSTAKMLGKQSYDTNLSLDLFEEFNLSDYEEAKKLKEKLVDQIIVSPKLPYKAEYSELFQQRQQLLSLPPQKNVHKLELVNNKIVLRYLTQILEAEYLIEHIRDEEKKEEMINQLGTLKDELDLLNSKIETYD